MLQDQVVPGLLQRSHFNIPTGFQRYGTQFMVAVLDLFGILEEKRRRNKKKEGRRKMKKERSTEDSR
jgi:hypothetical protein